MAKKLEDFENELNKLLNKIGLLIEGRAKELCPVDTGRLRASIQSEVADNEVVVGTNVSYAPYVEYGTHKMRAQPFLRPAVFESKPDIQAMINNFFKGR